LQLIRCDDKDTRRCRVWNIDDPQISPGASLSNGHTRAVPPGTVFAWTAEDIAYFLFGHPMAVDMWLSSLWIEIETDIHAWLSRLYDL